MAHPTSSPSGSHPSTIRTKVTENDNALLGLFVAGAVILGLLFIAFAIKKGIKNSNEKQDMWDQEVRVQIFQKMSDGSLVRRQEIITPAYATFDYAFEIWTDGIPIEPTFPGIGKRCYCANNERETLPLNKRHKGAVLIEKASKKCWKVCK